MKKNKNADIKISEEENTITNLKKTIKDLVKTNQKLISENNKFVEREQIFYQFFYQCPVHLFIKDHKLTVAELSKSFEKMLGIPAKVVVGKKMSEIFPSEFAKKIISDDRKVLKSNTSLELIEEFNGNMYFTIKFPLKLKDKKNLLAGLAIDISKQFIEYEALVESRKRYRELLELAVDGILIGSKEGFIIDANTTICIMTGRSKDELIGMHISDSFFSEESTKNKPFQFDALRKGRIVVNERVIVQKNGTHIPVEMRTKMMPDGTFQSIYRDITERKKYENDLLQLNADKDRFISILSHDLKSPFNSLITLSKLLNNNFDRFDKEQIDNFTQQFTNSAQSTYDLMDNLLGWARSQSGKMRFTPEYLNINKLCSEIFEPFNNNPIYASIKYCYKGNKNISVYADYNMLKTILRNLVANAVKFILNDGEIVISAKSSKRSIVISVLDNGIGICNDDLEKLFDIKSAKTIIDAKGEKGTGFGLLLCKEFVEKHGGKIWVESVLGKGSDFKFTIPLPQKLT